MFAFKCEMRKIFRQKSIMFFIILLLIGYFVYFVADIYGKLRADSYSCHSYQELVQTIDKNNLEKEVERLEKEEENISDRKLYSKNNLSEYHLYEDVLRDLKHVCQYGEYITDVIKNTERYDIGIFQQSSYMKKEQQKTAKDFRKLQDKDVKFAAYKGVTYLTNMDLSDAVLVIGIILIVTMLVTREKEDTTLNLLFTLPWGRRKNGSVKFFAGLFFVIANVIVLSLLKLCIVYQTYGLEGLGNVVQSMETYGSCQYDITVGQFLVFTFLGKLITCVMFYALIFCIAVIIKSSVALFAIVGIIGGAESLLYYFISENSWLHLLKKINIITFLSSNTVIGKYQNINIFGTPQNNLYVVFAVEIIVLAVSGIWGIFCFEGYIITKQKSSFRYMKHIAILDKLGGKQKICSNQVFLFIKEIKKTWIGEKGLFLFLVACFACVILYTPLEESYSDKDQIYYEKYMLDIQGKYSHNKINLLYQEKRKLQDIQDALGSDRSFTEAQRTVFEGKVERLPGLERAIKNAEYIKQNNISHFTYEKGYLVMFGKFEGRESLLIYRIIALLFMVGMATAIWGVEQWSKMDFVLQSSVYGKNTLYRWKRVHIFILSFLSLGITFIPWIVNVTRAYQCEQWEAPAKSIMEFGNQFWGDLPLGAVLAIFLFLHFLYLYVVGNTVRLFQQIMGSYILTVFTVFVLSLLPVFLIYGLY